MRGSRGFPSSVRLFVNLEQSEIEARAELQLARIERRCEAERIGRAQSAATAQVIVCQRRGAWRRARYKARAVRSRTSRAEHVVDAQEIGPVEEIERLDGEFEEAPVIGEQTPREAHVEAIVRFALAGVTPGRPGAVALRTPVGVGVEAEQQVERTPALRDEDRRERPILQRQVLSRALEDAAQHEAVPLIEGGERTIQPQVERILRRPVAVEIDHLVNRFGQRVMRVKAKAARETPLRLRGEAVVERTGRILVYVVLESERIAEIGRQPGLRLRGRGEPDVGRAAERVERTDRPGELELVYVAVARKMQPARELIAQFERNASAKIALNAETRLICRRVAVIRPQPEPHFERHARRGFDIERRHIGQRDWARADYSL